MLAFFAPTPLPRAVLDADPDALPESLRDKLARNRAIAALNRFSLPGPTEARIAVHRLVQAVTRDGLDEATAKAWAEVAVRLVNEALPNLPKDYIKWPILDPSQLPAMDVILPHVFAATEFGLSSSGPGLR